MGVDGDRKVSKEAMVQYAKSMHGEMQCRILLRPDLGWRLQDKLRDLLHRSPHACNPRVEMSTRCPVCRLVARWNGGSDLLIQCTLVDFV